jgi:WD40 repeat protein
MVISPDGKLAAAASESGAIHIFDLDAREKIASLRGHQGAVFSLHFSKDNRRLFAGGGGGSALSVWDLATQQELISLPGKGSLLSLLHFDEGENKVLLGSDSMREWQLWLAPSFEEIERIEKAGRWRGGLRN